MFDTRSRLRSTWDSWERLRLRLPSPLSQKEDFYFTQLYKWLGNKAIKPPTLSSLAGFSSFAECLPRGASP